MASRRNVPSCNEFSWSGCFIVLLAFMANFVLVGVHKTLGVLLPTLREQFVTHTWMIGIMVAAVMVTTDVIGIFVVPLERQFASRALLICSAIIVGFSLLLIPLTSTIPQIFVLLVVFVGPGIGVINVLSKVYIGRHFTARYTLACGIGHAGAAGAMVVFAPLAQLFLESYGWRGAVLLSGSICFHMVASAAVVRVHCPGYTSVPTQRRDSADTSDDADESAFSTACWARLSKAMDVGILGEYRFFLVFMTYSSSVTVYNGWIIYYVPHLEVKGISPEVAAALCSSAAVGYFLGTVFWAPFIDRGVLTCPSAIVLTAVTLALAFVADPWVDGVYGQAVITFVCGFGMSAQCTLNDVLTKDLFEVDRLTTAFGMIRFLNFMPELLAGFLPGWLFDTTGSYDSSFIGIGFVPIITSLPLVIEIVHKRCSST